MAFQNHLVGGGASHRGAQIPKRSRPDLAVRVDRTRYVSRMGLGSVNSAKARGRSGTEGGGIPLADASRISRLVGGVSIVVIEAGRQVVAEALPHGTHLAPPPARVLIVLHRMAIFVCDYVAILAVIHTSIAKMNSIVARGIEGLVCGIPVGMGEGREVPDAIDGPGVIIEPQAVEVALDRVDGMVDGHLLEPIIRAVVVVDPGDFIGIGHCQTTGQTHQIYIFTFESAQAWIKAQERHGHSPVVQGR